MKLNYKGYLFVALIAMILGWTGLGQSQVPISFTASSTTGVLDLDGTTYLLGDGTASSDLVQLIWAGPDGLNNPPTEYGETTGDDAILDSVRIGAGYAGSVDEGVFSKVFTLETVADGDVVYMRASNASAITPDVSYGDSELYTITSADGYEHDFGTWGVSQRYPIELVAFKASTVENHVRLEWVTESETENLGFNIYRSNEIEGERIQVNQELIPGAVNSQSRQTYTYKDRTVDKNNFYYYWLADVSTQGHVSFHGPVETKTFQVPKEYALEQNYPNPFNPTTTIDYSIKEQGHVLLRIYNVRGQMIRELVDAVQFSGTHSVQWDGRDDAGMPVPSGTYLYTLQINDQKFIKKMTFMK
jgi:hypothetical protein